jgi:hypothetical protein
VAGMSERSSLLADAATQRGWQYSETGENLGLADRWKWHVGAEHPFRYGSRGTGLTRRDPIVDVVWGSTPAGRAFWAFWTPHPRSWSGYAQGGLANLPTRCVAFVYTATSLPTVSAVSRDDPARPLMSKFNEWAARRADGGTGDQVEMSTRLDGWAVGSEEFRRHYKVDADDRPAAEWLAGTDTQERLLADPSVSLCSIGADILAWCDRGLGGDGFDIGTVDALLAILDLVELPR